MKINCLSRERGYALLLVLVFASLTLMTLGGALSWTATTSRVTQRNNEYYNALAAAEAATEKVLSRISRDFQNSGESLVYSSLPSYRNLVPNRSESAHWDQYEFSNGAGQAGSTHVQRLSAWGYTNLTSQYTGLRGMASTYRVISNARGNSLAGRPVTAAVRQEIQVACIPIFQFAIFYSMDLEINPGPAMSINGRVHSNGTIYTEPVNSVTYQEDVTAAGEIKLHKSPLDPTDRSMGKVTFHKEHDAKVSSLTLPIGTNNSPAAVRQVVEIPPAGESPSSLLGKQRYYNKSDLVIVVSNSTVTARSGAFNNFSTTIPASDYNKFLSTVSFYNKREGKTVNAVQIDVGKLKRWSETNATLRGALGRDLSSVYVADKRTVTTSTESGVRLVNGQTLPSLGLTVATPNPLYVQGHYNAPSPHLGTANTSLTKPASLVGDAITILSTAWSDANASKAISYRTAADTTVNAAFLAGIVPSDGVHYSGGVENFPRFLENWNDKTFTYNGSMVVMYYSQLATAPWGSSDVYNPPIRKWAFDLNFMDATKLPPGTPQLLSMIRGSWSIIAPNQIL